MSALSALIRRELSLAWGGGGAPLLACGFYAALVSLTPLSVGHSPERLSAIAPGLAWLVLTLACLLSLERLFERDYEDGALDLLVLGPAPLEVVVTLKALAQWAASAAPLALLAPLASAALGAPLDRSALLLALALLGGLCFTFLGGVGAALAVGSRRGGLLIAVLVLPLLVPPVIFGGGALQAASTGGDWSSGLALLAAYSLAATALSPFAMAAALRNALS